jgi:hypothetical protein
MLQQFCAIKVRRFARKGAPRAFAKMTVGLLALVLPTAALAAPTETAQGFITFYGAGWTNAVVRVQIDVPLTNPDGCAYTDGYVTDSAMAGAQLFNSTLLTAYVSRKKVSVVIDGCSASRARIIGVYVWP